MKNVYFLVLLSLLISSLSWATGIRLPEAASSVPAQRNSDPTDSFTCGSNIMARYLELLHLSSQKVMVISKTRQAYEVLKEACPRGVDGRTLKCNSVGPDPQMLVGYYNQHSFFEKPFVVKKFIEPNSNPPIVDIGETMQNSVISLTQGIPVVALIKVGELNLADEIPKNLNVQQEIDKMVPPTMRGFAQLLIGAPFQEVVQKLEALLPVLKGLVLPRVHFIMLTDFNFDSGKYTYLDTDGNLKQISDESLRQKWGWNFNLTQEVRAKLLGAFSDPALGKVLPFVGLGNVPSFLNIHGGMSIELDPKYATELNSLRVH